MSQDAATPTVSETALRPRIDVVFPVDGMTCAACVSRVERVLGGLPGITSIGVNLTAMTARVTAEGALPSAAIIQALDEDGYAVPRETHDFVLTGMTCAACVTRVERALLQVPGVAAASVDLIGARAHVETISGLAPTRALIAAIETEGYEATLIARDRPADDPRHAALTRDGRHVMLAVALTLPFLVDMTASVLFGRALLSPWLQFALALPVQFILGWRFYVGAWKSMRAGSANMDVLVAIGTTSAFVLSLVLMAQGHGHLYFESAAVVITLVLLGKWLEARARLAANSALSSLAALQLPVAQVLRDGAPVETQIDAVASGDVVLVKPGERLPVDGIIVEGTSSLDERLITGETQPVTRKVGDTVVGGSINGSGTLHVRATTVGSASRLARIVRLVERAQASKAPMQALVDRIAAVFVPVVIGIALATLIGWLIAGAELTTAMINAISVLVISCPCALGLATPAAISVGVGAGARAGILIRDADAMDRARGINLVVFDKTGTLTRGEPAWTKTVALFGTPEQLVRAAASVEQGSEHPMARAVVAAAEQQRTGIAPAQDTITRPGLGIGATVEGRRVHVGNRTYMRELGLDPAPLDAAVSRLSQDGATVVYVASDSIRLQLRGLIAAADRVRDEAKATVATLIIAGIRSAMLTGDARPAAEAIAAQVGISNVAAEVVPEMKSATIRDFKAKGHAVAMVGDGINDAAALAEADIGIAMGSGSDVAREAAHVTLMRDDLSLVPAVFELSRRTHAKIQENLAFAFVYNVIGIPLAAFGKLGPMYAGLAMALSSVSVVVNALRLSRWRPREAAPSDRAAP